MRRGSRGWLCRLSGLALVALMLGLADAGRGAEGVSPRTRELLNALGYLDYAKERDPVVGGVIVNDPARAGAGWSLLTYHVLARTELLDSTGRVLHVWDERAHDEDDVRWARATPLPKGDLLVVRRPGLQRIRRDGRLVWESDLAVHHHADVLSDGRIVTLTSRTRTFAGFSKETVIDNGIAILASTGRLLEEKSLLDMLSRRPDIVRLGAPNAPARPNRRLDVLHANRVDWLEEPVPGHEEFRAATVLVTLRHQDTIALIDWEKGEPVWAWGRGTLGRPHDATVLPNGHILVFDNVGASDTASRILEVDPSRDAVVWSWTPPEGRTFFSGTRGTVQRLANGNTLVGESNRGRAFEVTPGGEIVWEYRTPHRDATGARAAFRIERYPQAQFAWLDRSDDAPRSRP